MNKKTRDKLDKHFGIGGMFNEKIKIPLCDVISASWVMGDMNSERFWADILRHKKDREREKIK
jgi:hypothetical protein|tara:strand:+ start:943 stop:1131 length:189 start_codon:yes stop_codon:yes gene_type:complete